MGVAVPVGFGVSTVTMVEYPVGLTSFMELDFLAVFTVTDHGTYQTPMCVLHLPNEPFPGMAVPIGEHFYVVEHVSYDVNDDVYHLGIFSNLPEPVAASDIN